MAKVDCCSGIPSYPPIALLCQGSLELSVSSMGVGAELVPGDPDNVDYGCVIWQNGPVLWGDQSLTTCSTGLGIGLLISQMSDQFDCPWPTAHSRHTFVALHLLRGFAAVSKLSAMYPAGEHQACPLKASVGWWNKTLTYFPIESIFLKSPWHVGSLACLLRRLPGGHGLWI